MNHNLSPRSLYLYRLRLLYRGMRARGASVRDAYKAALWASAY